jgi:hypothetical protein
MSVLYGIPYIFSNPYIFSKFQDVIILQPFKIGHLFMGTLFFSHKTYETVSRCNVYNS